MVQESESSKSYNRVKRYEQMCETLRLIHVPTEQGLGSIYYESPVLRIPHGGIVERRMCKGTVSRVKGEQVGFSMAEIQCAHRIR